MTKLFKVVFLLFVCAVLFSCETTNISLNTYRRGNNFYIENANIEGTRAGSENIVINNITFFAIDYNILALTDKNTTPKLLWSGNVPMRTKITLELAKELLKLNDSLANYKYLCVQFPNGSLKKCSSYSNCNDIYIDIEQYGVETNIELNKIDESTFEELEQSFGK